MQTPFQDDEVKNDEVVEVVAGLVRALVNRPEKAVARAIRGTQVTVIEVRTARGDHGQLLGRRGRTARAVRDLLVGISGAQKRRLVLEILEPDESDEPAAVRNRSSVNLASKRFEDDPICATRALLTRLVQLLVDHRDVVAISAVRGRRVVVFEVSAAQVDINRIIGRGGARADAIRTILLNLGTRAGLRFILDITEPMKRLEG